MDEPSDLNERAFSDALKNAGLPEFPDPNAVYRRLKAKASSNVHHTPRQQGPYLVCVSCEHFHTLAYIGTNKKLVGIDQNGGPILEQL